MRQGKPVSKRLTVPAFALALVGVALASPAAEAAPVKIVGFDDMSCRGWQKSRDDEAQRHAYIAWVRGVVTGHNYARPEQQVSSISAGTVGNFVDRYCTDNPQSDLGQAAFRMTDRFSGRNEPIDK